MITITFASWMIPALITIVGVVWAVFIYDDGVRGWFAGIGNLIVLVPVLIISCISWIIWGVLK